MFTLYSLLYTLGFLVMLPVFLFKRKKYLPGLSERFGRIPAIQREGRPVIWVHCVSVGETNAASPLIKKLRESHPDHKIVVSTVTKTGQDLARELFGDTADLVFYFPFDWRFTVRRALRAVRPDLVLMLETEIWFNFFREVHRRGITLAIVNGRLSEKSLKGYLKFPRTVRRVIRYADHVLVQTKEDARRFKEIGARSRKIVVTGNIKHDQEQDAGNPQRLSYFRERFGVDGKAPLILAASTHDPEERYLLSALNDLRQRDGFAAARLMIAPRHPERFDAVAELLKISGFKAARRSSGDAGLDDGDADVILLDSIGELRSAYPLADLVFVGGSLIPHGGQNVLEPAFEKKAIICGPHMHNFEAAAEEFESRGALVRLPDEGSPAESLASEFHRLLGDSALREKMGARAYEAATRNRGAVERTLKVLEPLLKIQAHAG